MSKLARTLALDQVDIEVKIKILREALNKDLEALPRNKTRTIKKIKRWQEHLEYISDSLVRITEGLLGKLERKLECKFPDAELLHIAMFQPSTRNLFMELYVHFMQSESNPISKTDFENLISLSDMSRVIAMIGDSATELAVIHYLWRKRTADAGDITQKRAQIISNENMARLCDRWGLYEKRIHFDPVTAMKSEMEHIKGTLVEAVYGIVYINEGFDKIVETVKLLM